MKLVVEEKLEKPFPNLASVALPEGADLLKVEIRDGHFVLWALCDQDEPLYPRTVEIYKTGEPIPKHAFQHISTFSDGTETYHAFERYF